MAKKLNGDALKFGQELFGATSKPKKKETPKPKPPKKEEKTKEICPHCGRDYKNLSRHIDKCPKNPNRVIPPEPKPYVQKNVDQPQVTKVKRRVAYIEEEIIKPDWTQLILESVNTLRNLSDYLREIKEEGVKINLLK
ncbi:MAG: hypothetical protein ACTSR8_10010 [Promethearchaeota archaeon]